jgi:hypothetical protein
MPLAVVRRLFRREGAGAAAAGIIGHGGGEIVRYCADVMGLVVCMPRRRSEDAVTSVRDQSGPPGALRA